jgi:hypothetical protein
VMTAVTPLSRKCEFSMTPQHSPREIAFWLDAALLSLTSYDTSTRANDEVDIHQNAKTLVSVSCEYDPTWNDARAAETFAQVDARLREISPSPDALRRAFRTSPKSPLWDSGDYAKLLNEGQEKHPN